MRETTSSEPRMSANPRVPPHAELALRRHWPEYAMEGGLLGLFMLSACAFAVLLEHPASPVRALLPAAFARRALAGVAMALSALALIHSSWGKRSGAHMNPALTLTFFRLGKIEPWDALFYALCQFTGGALGMLSSWLVFQGALADPSVDFVRTAPGSAGIVAAFVAEALISFLLMGLVLCASNHPRWSRFTGLLSAIALSLFITFEAPYSGMSMNPARTLASALGARAFSNIWLYFVAPPLGMLLAAESYLRLVGARRVHCAKLHHQNSARCIFRCRYAEIAKSDSALTAAPTGRTP